MDLTFQVFGFISLPVSQVFEAVYNHHKLSQYFTTGGASAPLVEGSSVYWDFADFPGKFPVKVLSCVKDEKIILEWAASEGGYNTQVEFNFLDVEGQRTKLEIKESGFKENEQGLKSSYGNCMGWMQMIACLKAYLEYEIKLREGFFK